MALNLPQELNTLILSYLVDPTQYPDVNQHLNNLFFSYQSNFRLKQQQTSNSAKIEEIEELEEAIIPDPIAISTTKPPVLTSYRPDRKIRTIRPRL